MTDESLVEYFEAGQEPPGGFHHREHVRVAWFYLRHAPLPAALERFRTGLRRFAEVQGAVRKYHETMTTAYVLLIHERLEAGARHLSWDEFAAREADLLAWNPSVLDRLYRPETLASERARVTFVPADRDAANG
jgi:hypothetical protein